MKKIITIILLIMCFTTFAQKKIPSKMLKDIETITDEFTGDKTFIMKRGGALSIQYENGLPLLYFSLACSDFGTYIGLEKIYIIAGNEKSEIDKNDSEFEQKEISQRYMTRNASGTLGTSNYKQAEFATRIAYFEIWKADASSHMNIINAIISNKGGKVKFKGTNKDMFLDFDKKEASRMSDILMLFDFLTDTKLQ